jgi:2-methylisocitrate lyase-like PEP mutase family enzyme
MDLPGLHAGLRLYQPRPLISIVKKYREEGLVMSQSLIERTEVFRDLNSRGRRLLLPNAWDAASARVFEEAGFGAIGTTSAGIAYSLGLRDGQHISRRTMMDEIRLIVSSVAVPVTADIEAGYGRWPEDITETVRQVIQAGAVGINLEDNGHGIVDGALLDLQMQCAHIRAARAEANNHRVPLLINARTDTFLADVGSDDRERLALTIERGLAYLEAGADLIFVPLLIDVSLLRQLADAFDGRLSVMYTPGAPPAAELFEAGARRVSIGQTAMLASLGCVRAIADELRSTGTWSKIDATFFGFGEAEALFPDSPLHFSLTE